MKKLIQLTFILISFYTFSQVPQKMSYQAVIRNSSNLLIASTSIGIKISILQGSTSGNVVFTETHTVTTNSNGLATLEIGNGNTISSSLFSSIPWANGPFYIKTETDPSGGSNYSITGTSELLSVPYALYSGNTAPVGGFEHYIGEMYNGGIIYYLYKGSDGLEHGLIVHPSAGDAKWQNTAVLVNANRSWDGNYNTNLISNSPAVNFVTILGEGWYLPSIDELTKLYNNRFEINKALFNGNYDVLEGDYWSSTEFDLTFSWNLSFDNMETFKGSKTNVSGIRGIKSF